MAPRDVTKDPAKTERVVSKSNAKSKEAVFSTMKTTNSTKKNVENIPAKANISTPKPRPRIGTPKQNKKEKVVTPGSITKSAKKAWQRRPKPAHSGVPVPERMKKLLEKGLLDLDCSL